MHPVAEPVLPAEHKILAPAPEGLVQHFRIGNGEIGWRQHIEHLAHREFYDRLVPRGYAAHAGGYLVPPLLSQQKSLRKQIEWRPLPFRSGKAPILRLWLDQGPRSVLGRETMNRSFEALSRAAQGVLRYLQLPLRRRRQMRGPVHIGQ